MVEKLEDMISNRGSENPTGNASWREETNTFVYAVTDVLSKGYV